MRPLILLASLLALGAAKPQFNAILRGVKNAIKGDCEKQRLGPGVCAIVFEDGGCDGKSMTD